MLKGVDEHGRNAYELATNTYPMLETVSSELRRLYLNHSLPLPPDKSVINSQIGGDSLHTGTVADFDAKSAAESGGWYTHLSGDSAYSVHTDVDVVSSTELTTLLFVRDYFSVQKPLVVANQLTAGSNLWLHWAKNDFVARYGELWLSEVRSNASVINGALSERMVVNTTLSGRIRLAEFVEKFMSTTGSVTVSATSAIRPAVGYASAASAQLPFLAESDLKTPPMFDLCPSVSVATHKVNRRPAPSPFSLTIGPANSSVPVQARNASWHLVVVGTVQYFLIPPGHIFEVNEVVGAFLNENKHTSRNDEKGSGLSADEWVQHIIPLLKTQQLVFETTLFAGDVLFVPRNWAFLSLHLSDVVILGQEICELRNTDHRLQPLGGVIYGGVDEFKTMGRFKPYPTIPKHEFARSLKRDKKSRFPTFAVPPST